jgi:hypothetical protein
MLSIVDSVDKLCFYRNACHYNDESVHIKFEAVPCITTNRVAATSHVNSSAAGVRSSAFPRSYET